MVSQRRRNYDEKRKFQKDLEDILNEDDEIDEIDYIDWEDDDGWNYNEDSDWEADYLDDLYNRYYDDAYDDSYDYDDYDLSYEYPMKPGEHIEDTRNGLKYIVTEDYRLVNIMTGKYENYYTFIEYARRIL